MPPCRVIEYQSKDMDRFSIQCGVVRHGTARHRGGLFRRQQRVTRLELVSPGRSGYPPSADRTGRLTRC